MSALPPVIKSAETYRTQAGIKYKEFMTKVFSLEYRKSTYNTPYPYPHNTRKLNPTEFAKAGFVRGSVETEPDQLSEFKIIVEGEQDDSVFCPFCFKCLSEFEDGDNPWKEHRDHKPDCLFVNMVKNGRARQSVWMDPLADKRGGVNKEFKLKNILDIQNTIATGHNRMAVSSLDELLTQNLADSSNYIPGEFWSQDTKIKSRNKKNQTPNGKDADIAITLINQTNETHHNKMLHKIENFRKNAEQQVLKSYGGDNLRLLDTNYLKFGEFHKKMRKEIFGSDPNSASNSKSGESQFRENDIENQDPMVNNKRPLGGKNSRNQPENLNQTLSIPIHKVNQILEESTQVNARQNGQSTSKTRKITRASTFQLIQSPSISGQNLQEGDSTTFYIKDPTTGKLYPLKIPINSENVAVLNRVKQ